MFIRNILISDIYIPPAEKHILKKKKLTKYNGQHGITRTYNVTTQEAALRIIYAQTRAGHYNLLYDPQRGNSARVAASHYIYPGRWRVLAGTTDYCQEKPLPKSETER